MACTSAATSRASRRCSPSLSFTLTKPLMRKSLLVVILLLIVAGALAFFVFRRTRKPAPTPVAWHARVTTIAGDGSPRVLSDPFGIAVAKDGTIYFADAGENNHIRKISPDGQLTTFTNGGNDFDTPSGIALDANGNLYVADTSNNRVRKVTPQGEVSTIA